MRKREVIELRHRINCVGWPCASAVINKERSLTARPGKHAGVQEHGTPDIVMFVIPGRPEWLRRKKNCGREYRPSASPLVPMHAPTIPAHHEGNGFDLLFPCSSSEVLSVL